MDAVDEVYLTGQVLDGPNTTAFEQAIADRCGRKFAVAVNSCTQGLIIAQQVCLPSESKVLIPTLSFAATINSVLMSTHTPVFCDTDQNALIDIETMDMALRGAGINCVMYANLFGHCVDYDRIRLHTDFFSQDIFVIEDAAQSFGATYQGQPSGSLGDVSVLSFDPTKNLNNYGSGGMILTDSYAMYEDFRDAHNNGKMMGHQGIGTNSRMSEADCAAMLVKLNYFDAWQARRRKIAEYYIGELSDYVDIVLPGEDVESAWSKFVIRLSQRHALKAHLDKAGIESKFHYDKPLFELPVGFNYIDYAREIFRESTAFSRECLSLPIYPELTDSEVTRVIEVIENFLR